MFTHEDFQKQLGQMGRTLQALCEGHFLTELGVSVRYAPYYSKPTVQFQGAEAGQRARNLGAEPVVNGDHPHGWYAFTPDGDGRIRPQRHYKWEMEGVAFEAIETVDDLGVHGAELQTLIDQYHDAVEAREEAELYAEL